MNIIGNGEYCQVEDIILGTIINKSDFIIIFEYLILLSNGVHYSQKCCAYTALVIYPLRITKTVDLLIRKSVGKYHIISSLN